MPLAGLVLVLLALKRISDETGKPRIFKDFLVSVIFMAIGDVLFFLLGGITLLGSISKGFKTIHLGAALLAFLLSWVVIMIGAYFLRMSFNITAEATGVGTFETSATLIFYGAILMIVFFHRGVGSLDWKNNWGCCLFLFARYIGGVYLSM